MRGLAIVVVHFILGAFQEGTVRWCDMVILDAPVDIYVAYKVKVLLFGIVRRTAIWDARDLTASLAVLGSGVYGKCISAEHETHASVGEWPEESPPLGGA